MALRLLSMTRIRPKPNNFIELSSERSMHSRKVVRQELAHEEEQDVGCEKSVADSGILVSSNSYFI